MTSVVICSKGRKLSLVTNTSKVFATCSMKLMQNFVLQAKTNKQTNKKQTNKQTKKTAEAKEININSKVNRTNSSFNRNCSCSQLCSPNTYAQSLGVCTTNHPYHSSLSSDSH